MSENPDPSADGASGTADPAVDAIVTRAGEATSLPTADHNGLYTSLMEQLQRELDADPAAGMAGGPANGTKGGAA
ncbi:hypothetical protein CVV68_11365 [Arthrobacter livingstonensis]|uniref:Uncharacterized protein n=1 Tax=Arthrobacter livingstonensis TaxID=670078 RepID=A0A2V5LB71_9MICC|nr:hypothetical protein [Arthrobacter livingstonensis]PYI67013.1 hypothetical protein CVV68_11365 [Arthrobacter livingstonensis]